jgi:fermentation-respiration switch protein FrsA (DUF1100 family)
MTTSTPLLFPSEGAMLAGVLLRPDETWTPRPTVIVTGSWLTVKEQMPMTYARRLVEGGLNAFVFDFAGFGASGGEPRQAEIPLRKVADLEAAARFLGTLSLVTPEAVGLLAICASAQYGLAAIAGGAGIRSFVSVAGWYHDTASVAPFYGAEAGMRRRLEAAVRAVERYTAGGEVLTVPAYRAGDETAGMFFELDYYGNPSRGAVPTWRNEMAVMSWASWLPFDGLRAAPRVGMPTLIVHSDGCVFPENARAVYDALPGQKRLHWSSEGTQTDFYDQPAQVDEAAAEAIKHFRETLS